MKNMFISCKWNMNIFLQIEQLWVINIVPIRTGVKSLSACYVLQVQSVLGRLLDYCNKHLVVLTVPIHFCRKSATMFTNIKWGPTVWDHIRNLDSKSFMQIWYCLKGQIFLFAYGNILFLRNASGLHKVVRSVPAGEHAVSKAKVKPHTMKFWNPD